jgi:hypothetical protein
MENNNHMDEQFEPLASFSKPELIGLVNEQRETIRQLKTQLNYANTTNTNAS